MAIPENRMSTEVVPDDYIPPDDRDRFNLNTDYEAGPVALNDPSQGLAYQPWVLTWSGITNKFTVTPEITGSPQALITVANVIQCSFAFDQNGHVNIAYTVGANAYLYWYDTSVASWVQTLLAAGTNSPTLCLDDKRSTQTQSSDVMLWYTKKQLDLSYNLYKRQQRERYLVEKKMADGVYPFIHKLGMHRRFRNQLTLHQTS